MARDAVTVTEITPAAGVDTPAGTSINTSNGASIDVNGDTSALLVTITNTNTTPDHDVTFKAGAYPPAFHKFDGDLVENVNAASRDYVIDGSRFVQSDGKIYVDFESGFAGKIIARRITGV